MATLKPGQIGDFNGKIGQVVISKWRQLTVGRSTPKKSSKKATLTQLEQQSKFALVTTFISRVGGAISVGYQNSSGNLTPYNVAVRYHLNNTVIGEYPAYQIDYSKVRLSAPRFANEIDAAVTVTMGSPLNSIVPLTWTSKINGIGATQDTDKTFIVFYNVSENMFMIFESEAARSALTVNVRVPDENITDEIHGWMFFVSANRKLVSKTSYLGKVEL